MEDSRLKGYANRVTHPTMPLVRTFCVNCGKPKGWVAEESYEFISATNVIVICDECDEICGKLDLPELDIKELR